MRHFWDEASCSTWEVRVVDTIEGQCSSIRASWWIEGCLLEAIFSSKIN